MHCPLCDSPAVVPHAMAHRREFFGCLNCELVFLNPAQLPSAVVEHERYLKHRNHIGNVGYTIFLSRLVNTIAPRLPAGELGLDFGCGPSPVLAALLAKRRLIVDCFDPFFFRCPLKGPYSFITMSEVCEHFHFPKKEFRLLRSLMKPRAYFGVMTELLSPSIDFENWHYARDETHVSFYTRGTLEYIADKFSLDILSIQENVILMRAA